ncbi:uncharacterized protein DFL_006981 [Arthrobotrys flagrans]|uniref:Transcription factor TFIIIC triple barrel domain-containing protein n=1 Tax=Arthrobotrys flagrans TaxID=97331 RepID=A0A436ZUD5_ARTFL|nr:hypothetical protein DFL_006981 [Arthrobotrys flagrans]
MSTSNCQTAERVTIASRSPFSNRDSQPKEPVFDENEETESFYVILDVSGDDFAAYGKYRDGRKFRPRIGDRYYEDDASGSENAGASDSEGNEPGTANRDDENTDPEADNDDEGDDGGNESDGSRSSDPSNVPDGPRELSLQILDLDSRTPLVSYEGKIYSCSWKVSNGTEMIFEPPPAIDPSSAEEEGRKLKQNRESRLFATTVHRLEGWPGKLKPRGRDKQEVSTKARMFAERLDAVLEHRLKEAAKNEEDVSGVTMKKFSEGQHAPAGWRV